MGPHASFDWLCGLVPLPPPLPADLPHTCPTPPPQVGLKKEEAELLKAKLEEAGGTVSLE